MNNNRIAFFFSTSGHSGVDRIVKNLIPAIIGRGYTVDLLQVRRHGPKISEPIEGLNIIDTGTRHTYLAVAALKRYLQSAQPAVMFSDKDRVNRTALLANYLAGSKTRLTLSQGTTVSIDLTHRGWLERQIQRFSMGRLYRYADNVITVASRVADDMSAYTGLPRECINAVPSPYIPQSLLDEEQELPDHPWFTDKDIPIILGVGELSNRKDFATVIRAFAKLRKLKPCRLIVLGKGREQNALSDLAKQLGVQDDIDLAGFQPNPYRFMAHANLFVTASRWEGLPAVICEALAVGTPVIASKAPGHCEALQDGKIGALFNFGDDTELAKLMNISLESTHSVQTLKDAARPYEIEAATSCYLRAFGLPEYFETKR